MSIKRSITSPPMKTPSILPAWHLALPQTNPNHSHAVFSPDANLCRLSRRRKAKAPDSNPLNAFFIPRNSLQSNHLSASTEHTYQGTYFMNSLFQGPDRPTI